VRRSCAQPLNNVLPDVFLGVLVPASGKPLARLERALPPDSRRSRDSLRARPFARDHRKMAIECSRVHRRKRKKRSVRGVTEGHKDVCASHRSRDQRLARGAVRAYPGSGTGPGSVSQAFASGSRVSETCGMQAWSNNTALPRMDNERNLPKQQAYRQDY